MVTEEKDDGHGSLEAAALEYAGGGFRVFPALGKRPAIAGWQRRATSDPAEVRELWSQFPDANVGVLCSDGLLVVDADNADAEARVRDLLPKTSVVRTPRGAHFYLRGSCPNAVGILPGVDVRGRGGFVVGAGSVGYGGLLYRWESPPWEVPPACAPAEVLRLASKKGGKAARAAKSARRARGATEPIVTGKRNDSLTAFAGSMRGAGMSMAAIRAALPAENLERCAPPLSRSEVDQILRSAEGFSGPPPWRHSLRAFVDDAALDSNARLVLCVLATYANYQGRCWMVGSKRLGETCGLSPNTLAKAIRQLEAAGRIKVTRRPGKRHRFQLLPRAPSPPHGLVVRGAAPEGVGPPLGLSTDRTPNRSESSPSEQRAAGSSEGDV